MQNTSSHERQWTRGSYAAASFAIFILLYNLVTSIISLRQPTDGWLYEADILADPPTVTFSQPLLDKPTLIQAGDHLLKINGDTLEQIYQAQHMFFKLESPDWPDGTRLRYEVLRNGELVNLDVVISRASIWQHYSGYFRRFGFSSNSVMFVTGISFFVIGCLVFILRPSNRAAHALLVIGVGFLPIMGNRSIPTLFYPAPPVSIPFDNWTLALNPSLMYLVLAFPYLKAPLRRFPRLSVLLIYLSWPIIFNLAYFLNLEDRRGFLDAAFLIYPVQVVLVMVVTLMALIHTAVTVRDPVGRSQMKWLMVGVVSFVFVGVGGWLVSSYLFPETMTKGNWLITSLGWFLLPVCLAVAITRYRLFDIDVIIRKTLVYGVLSVLLGALYLGGVTLSQTFFTTATGQSSPLSIVLSTLAIAALFNPLRRRVQDFIDLRFYRQRYDAEQALASFAALSRRETNLEEISQRVINLVQETVQPEQTHLWLLRSNELDGRKQI